MTRDATEDPPRVARLWPEVDRDVALDDVLDDERRHPRPIRRLLGGLHIADIGEPAD